MAFLQWDPLYLSRRTWARFSSKRNRNAIGGARDWGGRNTRHEQAAAVLWLLRSSSPPRRKSEIPPWTGVAATAQTTVHATGAPLHRPTGHKIICLRLAQNALGRRGRIVRPQAAGTASRGENFRTTVLAAVIRFGWPCRAASSSFLERRRPDTMAMPGC